MIAVVVFRTENTFTSFVGKIDSSRIEEEGGLVMNLRCNSYGLSENLYNLEIKWKTYNRFC